jgi:hypothetical protein
VPSLVQQLSCGVVQPSIFLNPYQDPYSDGLNNLILVFAHPSGPGHLTGYPGAAV